MNLKGQLVIYMEIREITLSELSRKSGVPKTTIHSWLVGKPPKNMIQVKEVARVLDVSLDHLAFGNGRDTESQKVTEIDALLGDQWVSGLFEVRFRRLKR